MWWWWWWGVVCPDGSRHPCTQGSPWGWRRGASRPEGAGGAALEGCPPRAGCGDGRTQVTTAAALGRAPAVRTLLGQALRGRAGPVWAGWGRAPSPGRNPRGDFSAGVPPSPPNFPLRPSLLVEARAGPRLQALNLALRGFLASPTRLQLQVPPRYPGRETFSDCTLELRYPALWSDGNLPGAFSNCSKESL